MIVNFFWIQNLIFLNSWILSFLNPWTLLTLNSSRSHLMFDTFSWPPSRNNCSFPPSLWSRSQVERSSSVPSSAFLLLLHTTFPHYHQNSLFLLLSFYLSLFFRRPFLWCWKTRLVCARAVRGSLGFFRSSLSSENWLENGAWHNCWRAFEFPPTPTDSLYQDSPRTAAAAHFNNIAAQWDEPGRASF